MEPMGKANPANVTFENGEKHFTFSKFEVGQEYEYYIETRKKKSGDGTYEVCCKKKEEGGYGGAKGSWNTKAKCISMGMSYSKDLLLNPIIGQLGLTKIHEVIIPAMLNK